MKINKQVPHGIDVDEFIDWVNWNFSDESKRSRVLLAEVLKRLDRMEGRLYSSDNLEFLIDDEGKRRLTYVWEAIGAYAVGDMIEFAAKRVMSDMLEEMKHKGIKKEDGNFRIEISFYEKSEEEK